MSVCVTLLEEISMKVNELSPAYKSPF